MAPVEYLLHKSSGRRWINVDIELETGCGIVPLDVQGQGGRRALQWAVGLELLPAERRPVAGGPVHRPSQRRVVPVVSRSSSGCSWIAASATSGSSRSIRSCLAGSALADGLSREYTLNEIAIITRAGPARLLGLRHKGHLGVGADADVTVYSRDTDIADDVLDARATS